MVKRKCDLLPGLHLELLWLASWLLDANPETRLVARHAPHRRAEAALGTAFLSDTRGDWLLCRLSPARWRYLPLLNGMAVMDRSLHRRIRRLRWARVTPLYPRKPADPRVCLFPRFPTQAPA